VSGEGGVVRWQAFGHNGKALADREFDGLPIIQAMRGSQPLHCVTAFRSSATIGPTSNHIPGLVVISEQ
jgi:hypothetical protein